MLENVLPAFLDQVPVVARVLVREVLHDSLQAAIGLDLHVETLTLLHELRLEAGDSEVIQHDDAIMLQRHHNAGPFEDLFHAISLLALVHIVQDALQSHMGSRVAVGPQHRDGGRMPGSIDVAQTVALRSHVLNVLRNCFAGLLSKLLVGLAILHRAIERAVIEGLGGTSGGSSSSIVGLAILHIVVHDCGLVPGLHCSGRRAFLVNIEARHLLAHNLLHQPGVGEGTAGGLPHREPQLHGLVDRDHGRFRKSLRHRVHSRVPPTLAKAVLCNDLVLCHNHWDAALATGCSLADHKDTQHAPQ